MVRTGFVKAKNGSILQICFERPQACEGCRGCSKGLLPKKELLTAFGEAEIGDVVDVEMPQERDLEAALLAYGLPLCTLVIGLAVGSAIGLGDVFTLVCAFAGLAVGCMAAKACDKRLRAKKEWRPTVVYVHKADASNTERTFDHE